MSTLIPEYPRREAAFRGIASGALIAAVPMAAPTGYGQLQLGDDLVGDFGGKRVRTSESCDTNRVRHRVSAEITDKIIAELEAGRIPWVQPWGTAAIKAPLAMPRNAASRRGYSGINVLILWGQL